MSAKKKRPAPPPLPPKPWAKMVISGADKIIKICEDLRTLNTDGYDPYTPGLLAKIAGFKVGGVAQAKGTVCSPFTANVIGCALDPDYDTKDPATDEFTPKFNGGADKLPFWKFYKAHNHDGAIAGSLVDWNAGEAVEAKHMRRGDVLGIGWASGGGHTAFCWDVHLDENGDVDCFQFVGCNGHLDGQLFDHDEAGLAKAKAKAEAGTNDPSVLGGWGVTISGCSDQRWLSGSPAEYKAEAKDIEVETKQTDPDTGEKVKVSKYQVVAVSCTKAGTLAKAKDKIFDDSDAEISEAGIWYALPNVKAVDETFAKGRRILYHRAKKAGISSLRVARLFYEGAPPEPKAHAPLVPTAAAKSPKPAGHTSAPTQVVKARELAANPRAKEKVKPVPVKQASDQTLHMQHFVELALQDLYTRRWIAESPGNSKDVNDGRTQAALKAYQTLFGLTVDGKIGPQTLKSLLSEYNLCHAEQSAQFLLRALWVAKKIATNPGIPDGVHNDATRAATEEFQRQHGLPVTKVPDSRTMPRLTAAVAALAATPEAPGPGPAVSHLYWVGNLVAPGNPGRLRLHSVDLRVGEECAIHLHDETSGADAAATVVLRAVGTESEAEVPIPFPVGALVRARVVTRSAGEIATVAPLRIGRGTEPVDFRPYVDRESVPDEVLETIRRNRALWPPKRLVLQTKGTYAGAEHYDYKPPAAHGQWARTYIATEKVAKATGLADKHIAQVFVDMMKSAKGSEGQPASLQTYDNQIVTWGVGFGCKGDGVHIFENLAQDPAMRQLLDDLGIQYFDRRYHVVSLAEKKVISSELVYEDVPGRGRHKGKTVRRLKQRNHLPPLVAWRAQKDLLSAIISISEDVSYRTQILEAQWRVYRSNSTTWKGQDKVYSQSLFYLITHCQHWMPRLAKEGFHVEQEWESIGGSPSFDTDIKLALRLLNGFLEVGKRLWAKSHPFQWKDVRTRIKTSMWVRFCHDAKAEGFDPGEFVYTVDE